MKGFFGFAGGILLGGLVAGAVALLFAPRTGHETRRYLSDMGSGLKDRAAQTTGRTMEHGGQMGGEWGRESQSYSSEHGTGRGHGTNY
jgi:gas vesicle protein